MRYGGNNVQKNPDSPKSNAWVIPVNPRLYKFLSFMYELNAVRKIKKANRTLKTAVLRHTCAILTITCDQRSSGQEKIDQKLRVQFTDAIDRVKATLSVQRKITYINLIIFEKQEAYDRSEYAIAGTAGTAHTFTILLTKSRKISPGILIHELCHCITSQHISYIPVGLLHEGLAIYLEHLLASTPVLPPVPCFDTDLAQLMKTDYFRDLLFDPAIGNLAYSYGHAFCEYFIAHFEMETLKHFYKSYASFSDLNTTCWNVCGIEAYVLQADWRSEGFIAPNNELRYKKWLSPSLSSALQEARELAVSHHDTTLLPLHLLIAILSQPNNLANQVLRYTGYERQDLEAEPIACCKNSIINLPFHPEAMQVLRDAFRDAVSLNCTYVGTEHLLLSIVHNHPDLTPLPAQLNYAQLRKSLTSFYETNRPSE